MVKKVITQTNRGKLLGSGLSSRGIIAIVAMNSESIRDSTYLPNDRIMFVYRCQRKSLGFVEIIFFRHIID